VLVIHGTSDPLVPYGGGGVGLDPRAPRGTVIDVDAALRLWRELDGIPDAPLVQPVPRRDPAAPTRATRTTWGADAARLQVELIRVDGGGHAEPSIVHTYGPLYRHFAGAQNADLESAEEAWRFFRGKAASAVVPGMPAAPVPAPEGALAPSSHGAVRSGDEPVARRDDL